MAKNKRGNGEGTIYPRKNKDGKVIGYSRGAYWAHTAYGPKRRYVSGKTRAEVARTLRKEMADRDGGLLFDAGSITVGKYLERWLPGSVKDTVKQTTYESYERLARLHFVREASGTAISGIRPPRGRQVGLVRLRQTLVLAPLPPG